MSIKGINGKGVNRAKAVCDECGREEVVTCDYLRGAGNTWSPNEGQVKKKLVAHGWAEIKGRVICPSCEAKRKVVPMNDVKRKPQSAGREPTRAQRREIILALEAAYDVEAERYSGGYTDAAVAEELGGGIMPGWVAQLRDENYGPAGGNEEMASLAGQIDAFTEQVMALVRSANEEVRAAERRRDEAVEKKLAEVNAMKAKLVRIEQASDMRVRKS